MAGLYDSLSGKGILNAIGDNPVAKYVQSKYSQADLNHDVGGAIMSARNAISGKDEGAIPAPAGLQDKVDALQSDVRGALAPTDPAHNPVESGAIPTIDPNSQQAGANAQAAQQSELDATKQKVADDATKGGGVPTPVSVQDPAAALATRNQNIQAGVGHATTGVNQVPVPKPLSEQQQKNVMLDDTGKDTFKSMNTVGEWYNSSSFLMGMMQTGLSLLDGKGYSESFATGAKYFDQHYGQEQRKAWADDLLNKGYDRQEIQQYIETGDSKVLTSPEQRAFQQQQQQNQLQNQALNIQVGQQNLEKAQYENTPEMRALDMQERQNKMQYNQAMMQQMQNNMALKQQEAPARLQAAQDNAVAAKARAQVAMVKAGQAGGTVTNSSGQSMRLGGTVGEGGGWHSVLNKSMSPITNKGQILVADKDGNNAHYISGSPGAAHMAGFSANKTLQNINRFSLDQKGTALFGPTGEMSRSFGDFWGQRSNPDFKSKINTLQKQMESLMTDSLIIEQQGIRPSQAEIEHKVEAAGKLTDEHGNPLDISEERAKEIIQNYRDLAGAVGMSAEASASGANPQLQASDLQNQVAAGTVSPDGKWRAAKSGNQYDKSIWVPNN